MFQKPKLYIFLVTIFHASIILGQNLFVSNLYNNLVFSNPSFAAVNDFSIIQLNYRNQWPIDGIYNTYGASYFHSVENLNSNFGAIINYDRQLKGVFNTYSIGANYAYKMQTSRRNYFLFGLSGAYNIQQLNYSNLNFENPLTTNNENQIRNYPQINSGISLILNKNHTIGVSIINIYPFVKTPLFERNYNLSYIAHIEPRGYNTILTYIEPIANIQISPYKTELLLGSNFGFYNFKTGFLINQTNFKINSGTILFGISFENYEFIYTYDLNLSAAISINPKMAAHEVTFLRKFQYKGRSKRRGAIKCPDI